MNGFVAGYNSAAARMAPLMIEAIATMLEVRAEVVARRGEPATPAEADGFVAAVQRETARRLEHERRHAAQALTGPIPPDVPVVVPPASAAPPKRPVVVVSFERAIFPRGPVAVREHLEELRRAGRTVHVSTEGDPARARMLLEALNVLDLVEKVTVVPPRRAA